MPLNPIYRLALAGACAVATVIPIGAVAQRGADVQALQDNSKMDYLMYCAGLSPDGPEIRACFKRNRAKLSAGCSAAITAYTAAKLRQ